MISKLNVDLTGLGVGEKHAQILHSNKKVNLFSLSGFENKNKFI
jgi:hypothetical protein